MICIFENLRISSKFPMEGSSGDCFYHGDLPPFIYDIRFRPVAKTMSSTSASCTTLIEPLRSKREIPKLASVRVSLLWTLNDVTRHLLFAMTTFESPVHCAFSLCKRVDDEDQICGLHFNFIERKC